MPELFFTVHTYMHAYIIHTRAHPPHTHTHNRFSIRFYFFQIGNSLFDEAGSQIVPELIAKAKEKNVKIHLPDDFVTGDKFEETATVATTTIEAGIPEGQMVT